MKKKLGPLPLWAWVIIAGGTIGLVLYLRAKPATAATVAGSPDPTTAPVLDATAGAPPDVNSAGGGGTSVDPATGSVASLDDVYSQLLGISGQLAALPGGGQGLTDNTGGTENTPVQTFNGELTDFLGAVTALGKLQQLLNPKAKPKPKPKPKKKPHTGSGGAGKPGQHHHTNTPPRRTTQHVATSNNQKRADSAHAQTHQPAKGTHVTTGGNKQHHRTAKPKR